MIIVQYPFNPRRPVKSIQDGMEIIEERGKKEKR
jgi:hypothetical protein